MTSQEFAESLTVLLMDAEQREMLWDLTNSKLVSARTFADKGLLTTNAGVVLEFEDGSEFQLSIVTSR
jgi:hypothetical protein